MIDHMQILDYAGVVVFAITGCLVAARKEVDLIGFGLLAIVTGIGGGTMRDVILDRTPVFWVANPDYLALCVITAILMFIFARHVEPWRKALVWADAVGIAVFTVIGTEAAQAAGAHWSVAVLMGVMTATFGGIIRDLLSHEPTLVMRREVYVTACFAGACVYLGLMRLTGNTGLAVFLSMMTTFGIRAAAIHFRLSLPGYAYDVGQHRRQRDN